MAVEVEVKDLWKSYDKPVLSGINLRAPRGKITAVLGPSGAGKTTLLRIIAGLERQDRGHVFFDGRIVDEDPPDRRKASMVFQSPALMPHLDVKRNICFGLKRFDAEIAKKYARMLKIEKLLDKFPEEISGGEQQRVAIARALAVNPEIILLDEPFSHLDAKLKEELISEIPPLLRDLEITTIYVTHDRGEALNVSDHLAILIDGKILEEGDPLEVYLKPRTYRGAIFLGHNVLREGEEVLTLPPEAVSIGGEIEAEVIWCRREKYYWITKVKTDLGEIVFPTRRPVQGKIKIGIDEKLTVRRRVGTELK